LRYLASFLAYLLSLLFAIELRKKTAQFRFEPILNELTPIFQGLEITAILKISANNASGENMPRLFARLSSPKQNF
jgi:hypothetical protein